MTSKKNTIEVGQTVQIAPGDLLMERNIRNAEADKALVASISDRGVIVALTVALTDTQQLIVRDGHRRTLAAIAAGVATVPAYVACADSTEDSEEIVRVLSQRDANTHRRGLSTADEVGVVEQLAAFGLTAAQIAKQGRIKRDQVDAALAVAGSKIAKKATERYDDLTLDQAAIVAEFEDDPETVKALVAAAVTGGFPHVAQQARDARIGAAREAQLREEVAQAGVTLIEPPASDRPTAPLSGLVTSADRAARRQVTLEEHTACPGHVAWIESEWFDVDQTGQPIQWPDEPDQDADEDAWDAYRQQRDTLWNDSRRMTLPVIVYGCQGWAKNGHHDRSSIGTNVQNRDQMTSEQREKAKAERKLVIENNKAWAATHPVRREFLATLAKRKTAPKGTGRFLAEALANDLRGEWGNRDLAGQLLGVKKTTGYGRPDLTPAANATEAKCLMVALVQVLAAYETALDDRAWRRNGKTWAHGRYLRFLSDKCGYTLADVEKYAVSTKTV